MVSTRVGYAGGSKSNPTYHNLGRHSETIQIDYDPSVISYDELLEVFWNNHTPVSRSISRQYGSVIFYHDEDQKRLAVESKKHHETETGRTVGTEIVPYSEFWRAEDYHQKYRLRGVSDLMAELGALFPDQRSFVDSTATARINGYVGGNGTLEHVRETVGQLGLSEEGQEKLLEIARRRLN